MPETTESATFARPAAEVFDLVADFGRLSEWDPMFDRSTRIDPGPLGVGSRFRVSGTVAGQELDLDMEVVEFERPQRVVIRGHGDGLETTEEIRVAPTADGCEVTYHSAFETDKPAVLEAATKPAFVIIGKRAMAGMREWIGA